MTLEEKLEAKKKELLTLIDEIWSKRPLTDSEYVLSVTLRK